jgi:glucokinase
MNTPPLYAGLDVGGTSMKAGIVDDNGQPQSAVHVPTEANKGQEHGLAQMAEAIRRAAAAAHVDVKSLAGIGVATPGLMDIPAGIILDPPNLKPWRNVPVKQYVHDVFRLPTAFQNDANAAAFGEYWVGAGRGVHSLVMFTLGTGVGGGIIWDDHVIEGEHSHGGELGHIKIEMTRPRLCGCGRRGCLEAYASATSVVQRTREALAEDKGRSSLHRSTNGEELTSEIIFDAATNGDELAEKIVEDTAFYLAVGAMNLMHTINPHVIVFGGGMIAAGDGFLERIRHHVRELAFPVPAARTQIRYAQLGGDAGFIGAAACARQLVRRSS